MKTLPEWETNPENFQTDDEGNFKLKKDGTPKRKAGRKPGPLKVPYNYSKATKAKHKAQRSASLHKRKAQLAQNKANKHKALAKQRQETVNKLTGVDPNAVAIEEDLTPTAKQAVVFQANPGPQHEFLSSPAQDVLYGGAAGGGKSFALLVDPLRYVQYKEHHAIILRRSTGELDELIEQSRDLYPKAVKGAKFLQKTNTWRFPSGARIRFGYLDRDADVYQYQGRPFTFIGVDEVTQWPTEFPLNYLSSRLRSVNPNIICYIRCTANPGGVGAHWVKKRYIDPAPANEIFTGTDGMTRQFIPALLKDNPYLAADGKYEAMLKTLPPVLRQQLLEGNWDVNEGAAFVEFSTKKHVITPMEIPVHWQRFKGIDYGYGSESAVVWGAIDPSDGTLVIYRELYRKNLTAEDLARVIIEMERPDPLSVQGVLDPSAWQKRGYSGPTIAEALLRAGHKLRRADNNRISGKIQVHEYLKPTHTGRPRLQIFNTCPNLIRELQSIPVDKKNSEDVDTNAPDHAYDALRYLIMSRPRAQDPREALRSMTRERAYQPSDPIFGY